jgi:predicted amidohydrolase
MQHAIFPGFVPSPVCEAKAPTMNEPTDNGCPLRVAAAQMSVDATNIPGNVRQALEIMRGAEAAGVELLVFPECALTGYLFDSEDEVRAHALDVQGPEVSAIAQSAHTAGMHVVIGLLEQSAAGTLFNTTLLLGPNGLCTEYHKVHLPLLGADRFVQPGTQPPVVAQTSIGAIGLSVCFDLRFPEWARALALAGADVIANPTNWAAQAAIVPEIFTRVRAAENHLYLVVANRGDSESGVDFIGQSQIIGPDGQILAEARRGDDLLIRDIDLQRSRNKHIVFKDGTFELALFSARTPHLYKAITSPQTRT